MLSLDKTRVEQANRVQHGHDPATPVWLREFNPSPMLKLDIQFGGHTVVLLVNLNFGWFKLGTLQIFPLRLRSRALRGQGYLCPSCRRSFSISNNPWEWTSCIFLVIHGDPFFLIDLQNQLRLPTLDPNRVDSTILFFRNRLGDLSASDWALIDWSFWF